MPEDHFIPPHGGYEDLLSFRKARIVYDGTVRFCGRFMDKRDRTVGGGKRRRLACDPGLTRFTMGARVRPS